MTNDLPADVSQGTKLIRLEMIRLQLSAYDQARKILRSDHISVPERKAAIDIRDEFLSSAPAFVRELTSGLQELIDYTDGEECADPESCELARGNPVWLCSRCRLRELVR